MIISEEVYKIPPMPIIFAKDMLASYPISRLYDNVERKIKFEINQMFYENQNRYPNEEEYKYFFLKVISNIKCNITNYDLGIFDD